MSHQIDYSTIGWEQYEDLCVSLWFDEGYANIKPMGRRREGGRDAIFVDAETGDLTIFQFKRWATKYNTSKLKSMIKTAAEKVAKYKPKKFILNTAQEPNADVNDWIPNLGLEIGFEIEYFDRSWMDLRLNNQRQDLRRDYFGLNLAHHTWNSLVSTCRVQVARTVTSLSGKYVQEIYIQRNAERKFFEYAESDKTGLAIVDRSGRGKTSLLCKLPNDLHEQGKIVIMVRGDTRLTDDSGLERLVVDALGYDTSEYQAHLRDVSRLLREHNETCYVLLDGLSEADNLAQANRSLRNLLIRLSELGCFKLCFTCRDVGWAQVGYDLPKDLLFAVESEPNGERYELYINDFSDEELNLAFPLYCETYNVNFTLAADAKDQLRHPLLLRLFCEAHKDQLLSSVSAIPVAQTFDVYMDTKAEAITNRSKVKYHKTTVLRFLRNVAGQMWHNQDAKALHEGQWDDSFPRNMTLSEREELLQMLAQEGIISFREEPITFDRSLHFVFDELREYLLLRYLLSRLPDQVRQNGDINDIAIAILGHFRSEEKDPEVFMLLSLIGLLLPEISERQEFLHLLLRWDFQTFCFCLARIPPLGSLSRCAPEALQLIAEQLRVWFPAIIANVVSEIRTSLNYWEDDPLEKLVVAVKVTASPECKEITHYYTARKSNHSDAGLIEVNQISSYPTFRLSIGTENERVELHDPEKGMIIPSWHTAGAIQRTINSSFPPAYVGESFNVPERMALYDAWEEILQILTDKVNRFPLPTPLIDEREKVNKSRDKTIKKLNDEELTQYLSELFIAAISCYMMIVERYFLRLKNVLNLAAQMPCSFYFVTDRSSVKYGFTPVESEDDMQFVHRVLDPSHDIADPKWKITVYDDENERTEMILEDFVRETLSKMGKLRFLNSKND